MANQINLLNNGFQDKGVNIAGAETAPSVASQVQDAVKNQGVFTSAEKGLAEKLNRDVVVEEVLTEDEKAEQTADLFSIIKFVKRRFPKAGLDDIYQQLNDLATRLKFKRELEKFETDFEKLLIQLVKRCAQHNVEKAIGLLSFIDSDPAVLVEIAKMCAQKNPRATTELIAQFGITDEQALIEIAKICAEKNGTITAFNISRFKITDQKALIEIAMLSVRQSAGAAVEYLDRFGIKDHNGLAEILMVAAHLQPKDTANFIRKISPKERNQLLQVLLVCLQTDPAALGDFSAKSTILNISQFFSIPQDLIIEHLPDPDADSVGLTVYEQVVVIQRYLSTQQKGEFYDLCASLLKPLESGAEKFDKQQEYQLTQINLAGSALILMEYNDLSPSQMQKLLQTPLMLYCHQ